MAHSPSALRMPSSPSVMEQVSRMRSLGQSKIAGLSTTGLLLLIISTLVLGSGFLSMRPEVVAGLRLHPYLLPVAVAFPLMLLTRIQLFPWKILVALLVFTGMYYFSVFNGTGIAIGEVFKLGSAVVTIITCALLVRRRGDFVAGVIGLNLAAAMLAYHGLTVESGAGVEAIEGANRNSYSLFALPAILLAGYTALRMPTVPIVWKSISLACTVLALAAIFMSGNRSGYLGAVLVALMLLWNRRGKGLLLVAAVASVVAYGIIQYGSTKVLNERLTQTLEQSETYRRDILWACWDITMQNPLIGVSPQQLPFEIGRRTSNLHHYGYIESHNVLAHVMAGSGLICLAALLAVGYAMFAWKPSDGLSADKDDPARAARSLMRMMVILWFVRGMFTREILYNPSFNIALGLVIGLCILEEAARSRGVGRPRAEV